MTSESKVIPSEVLVDNSTIEKNGSNQLTIKGLGVDTAQLAADAVTNAKILDGTIDPVKFNFSGAWELVEEKSPGSATQNLDFDATLDGTADGAYMLVAHVENATGSALSISLRLNGASMSANVQSLITQSTSISASTNNAIDQVGSCDASSSSLIVMIMPLSRINLDRRYFNSNCVRSAASDIRRNGYLVTPAAGNNITSMGIGSSVASSLDTTTVIRLYKLIG